ncbi:MAG TPA: peptidylprolyl isomerase [Syntrophales bacterium]|nr:peptidylprolyl isomerase [Syntrophales bacterium]HOX94722.1 peptidylprolyl isomerase [Syntrophales bacterium]HPI57164.1 peptidylprolyl isomerase [Syntrophales bacterium]HPN24749.1 peptidylprolyl isomerase [Syntrophales bacterium]HQM29879.1 peptidylprolyl isomerase [Syntrophales bacterium]
MKMKWRWLIAVAALLSFTGNASAEVADRIVAIVNEEVITQRELNLTIDMFSKRIERSNPGVPIEKIREEVSLPVLNNLIEETLLKQEARRLGITVKDEEVTTAINDLLAKRKWKMEDVKANLDKEGMSFDEYREATRNNMIKGRVIRREIQSKIAVSNEEIGNYYREHRDEYEGQEAARIRQIMIPVPGNIEEDTRSLAKAQAEDVLNKLKSGVPFEQLAVQYRGPGTGDMGYVEKGTLLPAVDDVAFKLKVGEISDVIESPAGFHIIQVVDKRGGGAKPLPDVRNEIEDIIGREKAEKKFADWMADLRKRSYIEVRLK